MAVTTLLAFGLAACDELTSPSDTEETDGPPVTGDPGTSGPPITGDPGTAPSSGLPTDDLTGIDDGTVTASIRGLDGDALVGSPITLDGSGSTNTTDEEMTFSWTVRERPTGSVAAIADPEAEITSFTPDRPGEYRIRLVVRAGEFEGVDNLTFETAGCPEAVVISGGTISSDEVWASQAGECPAYVVEGTINVTGELRIEAGTTILFRDGAGIQVSSNGALRAEGTADAPITFRGTEVERGWWQGLYFLSDRPTNRLFHVIVENAGSEGWHGSVPPAGVTVSRSSYSGAVRIQDSILRNNAGNGLSVHERGGLPMFERNTLTGNERAATMSQNQLVQLDGESSFTGNDIDVVSLTAGRLSQGGTIRNIGVPYRSAGIEIQSDDLVTFEAGIIFEMRDSASVTFLGTPIILDGTEDDPIHFRGTEHEPGWWEGVFMRSGENPQNRMNHVIIEHGGGSAFAGTSGPAGLTIGRGSYSARVALHDLTLRNNAGTGLRVHGGSDISEWSNNTFENNGGSAAVLHTRHLAVIDANSTASDNDRDVIDVDGGDTSGDATWTNPGFPYRVTSGIRIRNDHHITIEAGTTFIFEAEQSLINEDGRLDIAGTTDQPVRMIGSQEEAGWWNGLFYRSTSGGTSTVEHLVVEDAGRSAFPGTTGPAGIAIGRGSYTADVTVHDTEVSRIGRSTENTATGIRVHANSTVNADICDVNTFSGINGPEDCIAP